MRAKGHLIEIRAQDLRFREEEVAVYIDRFLDSQVDAKTVTILTDKT